MESKGLHRTADPRRKDVALETSPQRKYYSTAPLSCCTSTNPVPWISCPCSVAYDSKRSHRLSYDRYLGGPRLSHCCHSARRPLLLCCRSHARLLTQHRPASRSWARAVRTCQQQGVLVRGGAASSFLPRNRNVQAVTNQRHGHLGPGRPRCQGRTSRRRATRERQSGGNFGWASRATGPLLTTRSPPGGHLVGRFLFRLDRFSSFGSVVVRTLAA